MKKILEFFKNTTVRVISALLLVLFLLSIFLFFDAYVRQVKKGVSFYWVYRGDKYYKKNKTQRAIDCYKKALVYYPNHYRARYNLANIYVTYEDYYSALNQYADALEIKPDFMIARIDYALVLSEATFNHDRAIEEYQKAIDKKPKWIYIPFFINNRKTYKYNTGIAYYNMGLAYRAKSLLVGEKKSSARQYLYSAIESYKNALKTLKSYEIYYNLALANQLLKNNEEAGINYCKAIELAPLRYEAHYNLAILLRDMKLYRDSLEEFKKAGLILDTDGDGVKTRYIYDVLSDVTQKMVQQGDYKYLVEHIDEKGHKDGYNQDELTYVGGKLVVSEEFDRAVLKNFRTCSAKVHFKALEED